MPVKVIYMSVQTIQSVQEDVEHAIKKASHEFHIEEALIKAFIRHESQNYIFAYRVDYQSLKRQRWYGKTLSTHEKKQKKNYASYGLMQILYGLAKSIGFDGDPHELFDPEKNIHYACKHLKGLLNRYTNIKDAIHSYNWGSPARDENGEYKNKAYVKRVYTYYKRYGGKR